MKILDATEVRRLLPMQECIEIVSAAMSAASAGAVRMPPRLSMPVAGGGESLLLMAGAAASPNVYGAKIVSLHPANPAQGRPTIQGFVALFDGDSGAPLAVVDGAALTEIRTAAASAVATRHLARAGARTHGIFGTGALAVTHLTAINAVRPCEKVLIWGRHARKARALARRQAEHTGSDVVSTADPAVAAGCDVVTTVTGASEPVVRGRWIRPGTHVNLVGSHSARAREADSDLIASARVFTDRMESLFNEGGDVLIPLAEGRIERSHVVGEIGRVINGEVAGRTSDHEITVYKSHGITAQDLFAAHAVYTAAISRGEA